MAPRKPKTDAETVNVRIVNHHLNRETRENYIPGETRTLPAAEAERLIKGYVAVSAEEPAPDDATS